MRRRSRLEHYLRLQARFADEWPTIFFSKLLRGQRHAHTIAALEATQAGGERGDR